MKNQFYLKNEESVLSPEDEYNFQCDPSAIRILGIVLICVESDLFLFKKNFNS